MIIQLFRALFAVVKLWTFVTTLCCASLSVFMALSIGGLFSEKAKKEMEEGIDEVNRWFEEFGE